MSEVVDLRPRTDFINQDNFLGIKTHTWNAAALVEGSQYDVTFRVRAQAAKVMGESRPTDNAILQELNTVLRISDDVTLSLGKRLYSLDQSYIGQPLGFFQKQVDLSDPTDAAGRAEGLPMAVLSWADEDTSLTAIYSSDVFADRDGFNRGVRQWLLRYGREMRNLSMSVVLRGATGESVGFGGTFSATLADDVSAYGSFYQARGTLQPTVDPAVLASPRASAPPSALLGPFRKGDGKAYPRAALGVIYTPRDLPRAQLELIYDRRGLSNDDYDRTVRVLTSFRSASLRDPAALVDLAYAAPLLQSRGARRTYLSVNVDQTIDAVSFGAGVYAGLADDSSTVYASAGWSITRRLGLSLSAVRTLGKPFSEFRLSPVSSVLSARIKYTF